MHRETSKTFHVTEASDFDLDYALKKYVDNNEDLNDDVISKIIDLKPIIGKRHYIETGNFRFLRIVVKTFHNYKNYLKHFNEDGNGEIIICLPTKDEVKTKVKNDIEKTVRSKNFPLAIALPMQSSKIIKLIKKLYSLELLQKNDEIIKIDKIARKEVATAIDLIKKEIEYLIEGLFFNSDWFVSTYEKKLINKWIDLNIKKPHTLNSNVSSLFDEFFPYAPIIKNELTNKTKVSGNASQAIKTFLNKLLISSEKYKLGIEKTPPELTIYNSYVIDQYLHNKIKKNFYEIQYPGNNSIPFKKMWSDAINIMNDQDEYVNAETLVEIWSKSPYGIKKGAFPIILMLFILTNKNKLAVYQDNVFVTDFDDYFVECLIKLTKEFSFTIINFDNVGLKLEKYFKIIKKFTNENINPDTEELPLNIGKSLVRILKTQPEYIKTTQKLSLQTLQLRNELKKANDPIDLVIKVLPKIFKNDDKIFEKSLLELTNTYDKFLNNFNQNILKHFNYSAQKNDLEELNLRAKSISRKSGDLSLDPFILQMQTFDNSKGAAESVLLNLLKKNPKNMNDNDIEKVHILLSEAIDQFYKVETHAKVSNRKYKSTSVSILYGGSETKKVYDFNFKLTSKEKKEALKIAQKIENTVNTFTCDNQSNLFENNDKVILGAISEYLSNRILDKKND